jgi:hypothetical protein
MPDFFRDGKNNFSKERVALPSYKGESKEKIKKIKTAFCGFAVSFGWRALVGNGLRAIPECIGVGFRNPESGNFFCKCLLSLNKFVKKKLAFCLEKRDNLFVGKIADI